ncbi:integrase [Arthrobacter sp. UYEF6]
MIRSTAAEYLLVRRALGYKLVNHEWLISDFLDTLEQNQAQKITVSAALAWACRPQPGSPNWHKSRLTVIRSLAAYIHTSAPEGADLIPEGLITAPSRRTNPYLYSTEEIHALIQQAHTLKPAVRAETMATIIGLMASTGMRVSEALGLDRDSLDAKNLALTVTGKGGALRLLPVQATTITALQRYIATSRKLVPTRTDALFVNLKGTRPLRNNIEKAFRVITADYQWAPGPGRREPRLHDLRHTFAVNSLMDAHLDGTGVEARIAALAAYLGHVNPHSTYWYLSASPELLQIVNDRVQEWIEGHTP